MPDQGLNIVAKRLREAREKKGLSQKALGIAAGIDEFSASPRINQYERGKHEPQLKTAKRLAEVLGIPPAFLYTEDNLLAALLLRWNELSLRQKKDLLKQVEGVELSKSKRGRLPGK